MKVKIYIKLILFIFLVLYSIRLSSQVTVGTLEQPVAGAILDIRTVTPDPATLDANNNITSETGGIVLPRVKLQTLTTLSPFVSDPNDNDVKKTHIGLIVYNIEENSTQSLVKGIYCWDENKWNLLVTGDIISEPWFKIGTKLSSRENTDNSYLSAKTVVGGTSIAKINGNEDAFLTVIGGDASFNEITVGKGKGNVTTNTVIGKNALSSNTSGSKNTAIGANALQANTTGVANVALGSSSMSQSATANNNITIGANAGNTLTNQSNNILLGEGVEPSGVATTSINIANTVFGAPGASISNAKVGINTNDPKATLHVVGNMMFTDAPSIAGGNVMMIDNAGKVGKALIPPRLAVEVVGYDTQNIGATINGTNTEVPITWQGSVFSNTDIAEINPLEASEIIFTKEKSGNYEVSGYVSYNPKSTSPASYPTSLASAQSSWLIVLNVLIQKYNIVSSSWETLTGAHTTWTGAAMGTASLIKVPPTVVSLSKDDKLRIVLIKPTLGKDHGVATVETIVPGYNFSTKGLKLVNL